MSPAALHAGSKIAVLMLDAAFRSLLLAILLAAVIAAFRVRAVHANLLVWRSLLLIALAMPLLILLSPAVRVAVPIPSFSRNAIAAVTPSIHAAQLSAAAGAINARNQDVEQFRPPRSARKLSIEMPLPQAPIPGFALPPAFQPISWTFIGIVLYSSVALFFFARLLIGVYFGRRLLLHSQRIADAEARYLLAAAARVCALGKLPHLAESDVVTVPVTLGVLDPVILLPEGWRSWDRDELAAVLAHEVSHVERRDASVQLLALIHRAIFWFSPLSWWLERQLADLAEQASDEAALMRGADSMRYAEALLGFLADLEKSPRRVWWHGVAMAKAGEGEKRVERILAWRFAMSNRLSRSWSIALVAVCVPVIAFSVAAHPSAYRLQDSAVPAPPSPAPPPPPAQIAPPVAVPVPLANPTATPSAPPNPSPAPAAPMQPPAVPAAPTIAVPVPPPAQSPSEPPPTPAAPPAPVPVAPQADARGGYPGDFDPMDGFYWPWGPTFVIVTRGSDHLIVSGTEDDAEHARALRSQISGDFIWFERDGKSYIIRDQALIDRAKQIWAQRGDSAKLQQELQAKQRELSEEMQEQVQQRMQDIRIKVPDMSADLQKLQSEVKALNANGATMQQLGDLQREVGELQRSLGQAQWNSNMREINRRAGELGRQMGELGRQIGEIARRQIQQGRQAAEQMRSLLDDAITQGKAKPE
jgi:beta-lactamase regulating signal transducer with metallopeptidase domain